MYNIEDPPAHLDTKDINGTPSHPTHFKMYLSYQTYTDLGGRAPLLEESWVGGRTLQDLQPSDSADSRHGPVNTNAQCWEGMSSFGLHVLLSLKMQYRK